MIHEDQLKLNKSKGLKKQDLIQFLNDGDVEFGKSKKQGNPLVYVITKTINGKEIELWFTLPKDSYISEIQYPKGSIQSATNSTAGIGEMILFPKVDNMVFLDNNAAFVTQRTAVRLKEPKQVLKALKTSGRLDFKRSSLLLKNLPEHYILFKDPAGKTIGATTTWYQDHIQFYKFDSLEIVK